MEYHKIILKLFTEIPEKLPLEMHSHLISFILTSIHMVKENNSCGTYANKIKMKTLKYLFLFFNSLLFQKNIIPFLSVHKDR